MPSIAWTMMEVHLEVRCWKINVGKRDVFVFCEYTELEILREIVFCNVSCTDKFLI